MCAAASRGSCPRLAARLIFRMAGGETFGDRLIDRFAERHAGAGELGPVMPVPASEEIGVRGAVDTGRAAMNYGRDRLAETSAGPGDLGRSGFLVSLVSAVFSRGVRVSPADCRA